ncbi:MAG: TatD family hydrolase [Gammaproteobacteria bacterium]
MQSGWFDTGANLAHASFSKDVEPVVQRALDANIKRIAITGSDLDSSTFAIQQAQTRPDLFVATCGLHPHLAHQFQPSYENKLRQLAQNESVKAVGEMGLDFFRNLSSEKEQIHCLERQLRLAIDLRKPVFLHQRNAFDTMFPIVREALPDLPAAVIHCFTGTEQELGQWLQLGLYIGITGWICDERRGKHLWSCVDIIPEDRLMIETDAPYLRPRQIPRAQLDVLPDRHRNEPCMLPWVAAKLAECRQCELPQLQQSCWQTSCHFFGIDGTDR